ncbi:MAG: QueT transporter family protein [Clostridiales bacterium]|jgi:uncharacterized membrane protein|nr:QueT transporter family protein [Clostridiales bacterium]
MKRDRMIRRLIVTALTAAVYTALTLAFAPISFGSIQFRVAEILNLMAYMDPLYGAGVVLGCFLSNCFSQLGPIDMVIGTLGTALAVWAITRTKNLFIASLWPMFANTLVAFELTYIEHTPLWFNIVSIWIGEFVVVTCAGYPLFRTLLQNKKLLSLLQTERQ